MEKTILDLNFIESHLENFCGDKLSAVDRSSFASIKEATPYKQWKEDMKNIEDKTRIF
jgi:hypothetical protein